MNNPYSSDPGFALYPEPRGATGDRLCRVVLGMEAHDYLRHFVRVNTVVGPWSPARGLRGATEVFKQLPAGVTVVLLGRQVWDAWRRVIPGRLPGKTWEPFRVHTDGVRDLTFVLFPHPSGLCRVWNDPGALSRARVVLRLASPELSEVMP